MLLCLVLLITTSFSLNPLDCNGIVFTYQGQINAEPAGVCQSDTYSYVNSNIPNFSFMYYCNGDSIYTKQWHSSSTCSGASDYNVKTSEIIETDPDYGDEYFEECNMTDCEYAKSTTYFPFDDTSDIYYNKESCDAWSPTATDSGYMEAYYIRDYCYDYNYPPYNVSAAYSCFVASGGLAVIYEFFHDVSDCSGTGELSFSAYVDNKCFQYTDHYQRETYECDGVPTPSPTPQWTQPVTELPCNAIEFEYEGTTVAYPVNVCIHDQISSRSLRYYCDGDEIKFHQWDSSTSCEGTATFEGDSFQSYIDEQSAIIQGKFGSHNAECGKSECEYVVMKEYTYTGDCDAFTATESTPYTETYFIRDYCLAIDDGVDTGSLSWGCDMENGQATWISFRDVTDCSDLSKASLSWVDIATDQCLSTTLGTNYVDVTCYTTTTTTTAEPTAPPTKAPTKSKASPHSVQGLMCIVILLYILY